MTTIPVADRKYARLSIPARRVLAALERQREPGDLAWEVSAKMTGLLADCKMAKVYAALRELVEHRVIAVRYLDDCAMRCLVAPHANRAHLDPDPDPHPATEEAAA